MGKRRAVQGAGAASIAVMATLAGAPAATAQEVCIKCEPDPVISPAFHKLAELKFPGTTEGVFIKIGESLPPAFHKLSELKFPGITEGVFSKFSKI